MVVKMKPFTVKCQNCGWHKVVAPKSDVLIDNDYPEACPVCESKEICKEDVGFLTSLFSSLKNM